MKFLLPPMKLMIASQIWRVPAVRMAKAVPAPVGPAPSPALAQQATQDVLTAKRGALGIPL